MRDLVTKIGRFCENHVEKIVLVLVGLVCVWLFFTRVIFSPVVATMDNRTFTPGRIDIYIHKQKVPELKTASRPDTKTIAAKAYKSPLTATIDANDPLIAGLFDRPVPGGFTKLFDSPLAFISSDVHFTKPASMPHERMHAGRKYRLPPIPDVTEPAANYLRAAAYVPLEEITPKTTYDKAKVEPNDIDLVTVEAKFDAAELYRRFEASFNGVGVQQEEWRDPCLATPVFAAIQLERQELRAGGTWSPWQAVPRTRIEPHRTLFQVIEKVDDLPPGGLDVRLMQFREKSITMELLQPDAYQIASAEEDWFPPSYYEKFKTLQKRVEMDERRKQKEERDKEKNTDTRRGGDTGMGRGGAYGGMGGRSGMATGRNPTGGQPGSTQYNRGPGSRGTRGTGRADQGLNPQPGGKNRPNRRGPGGTGDQMYPDMYAMPGTDMGRRRASTNEAYMEFAEALLSYNTDLAKLEKPLLFWVFDDTVEPGRTYQYRVRLGVFNPVAGTSQLADRDMDKKNQAILWSPYSGVTKPIEVHDRLYLFAKDVQNQTRTATVEVARYNLGYWRSEDFQVKLGESIGKEVERKEEKKPLSRQAQGDRITDMRGPGMPDPRGMGMGGMGMDYLIPGQDRALKPEKVDYTTGKVLVDLVEINDWGGAPNLHPRKYHDMLYTGDGTTIEHMPVNVSNWPKDLVATYQFVQSEKRREPQPFRSFNKGGLQGRGRRGMMPGGPGYEDMGGAYDDMGMYDMQQGQGPYNR
jgi:hypothetical protein